MEGTKISFTENNLKIKKGSNKKKGSISRKKNPYEGKTGCVKLMSFFEKFYLLSIVILLYLTHTESNH